jgi:hypothetical protein
MPITLNYDQWMKRTYSDTKGRSVTLKKIDEAVRIRDDVSGKQALKEWVNGHNRKGVDWHRSVRNQDGAVEVLAKQLLLWHLPISYTNITQEMDDKLAKVEIRRAQRLAKQAMFFGKKLKFKNSFWGITERNSKSKVDTLKAASKNLNEVHTRIEEVRGIAANIKVIIDSITKGVDAAEASKLTALVFGASVANFARDAAPIIGCATSGANMVRDWVGVAMKVVERSDMESREEEFRMGDASAAFGSILQIIDRDINKQVADGTIHTAAFAAKSVGLVVDAGVSSGPVVGAIESLASLLNTLVDVVIDAKQMSVGNKMLKDKNFDVSMFNACPILGCYYIVIQDHSTVMDFDFENMGKDGWKGEALRLEIAIKPVIAKGTELIDKSRIEIAQMGSAKGVYQAELNNNLNRFYKAKGYAQNTKVPGIIESVLKGEW